MRVVRGLVLGAASAICLLGAVAVGEAAAATGGLTQKAGTAGCVSQGGAEGCAVGRGLDAAFSVAVSPDGASAYVASAFSDAVAVFDRAPDGTLTQRAGTAGCVAVGGDAGCAAGRGLNGAYSAAVSPDGTSVYVASFRGEVAVLDRAPDGALTQKAGRGGCISSRGGRGCADGAALKRASSVAVSPDGRSAYIASLDGGAVAVFDRSRRPRPIFARPGVNARQRRRRVVVVVAGRLVDTRGSRCVGKVAVGARTGGRRARHVFRIQRSGEGRCTYRTVFRFRVAKLRRAVRSRGRRLLVRVNASYKGSHELQGDRAPSVLERVVR